MGRRITVCRSRLVQANRIARAVGLDIVQVGWQATVENYLGRVPKALILEAVTEAKGREIAGLMKGLKKSEMAKEAQRLLEGSAWLPMPLRLPAEQQATDPGDGPLPAFLEDEGQGAPRR